ncbi:hypothetical protein GCM10009665_53110 [Kitasatospora nipponensis]|uniref:N-acetyltransferase domain-containing protein n=1 Tax=Kitasatospora nipponensis TaxID=258049 RepID=A0ABN1WMN9_9ACTN
MNDLRIEPVTGEVLVRDWRHVHNLIIPTDPLSLDEVRERSGINRLEVAYLGDVLVGCSTVRPPAGAQAVATVIARVLPAHRGRGFGAAIYERGLAVARELGAGAVETIVLASNVDGVRFAQRHGFTEVSSELLPGDTIPYLTLRLG